MFSCSTFTKPLFDSTLNFAKSFLVIIPMGCEWKYIRIYHECEGRIEKSIPRITLWHHEACRVMTKGDPEGWIFLSYSHTKYLPKGCEWNNIRIYHECEGRIEKSILRITDWHHEACRVMTNGDPEGQIFLSYPHTNNGFFFLLTTVFIYFKISFQKSLNTLRCYFT